MPQIERLVPGLGVMGITLDRHDYVKGARKVITLRRTTDVYTVVAGAQIVEGNSEGNGVKRDDLDETGAYTEAMERPFCRNKWFLVEHRSDQKRKLILSL